MSWRRECLRSCLATRDPWTATAHHPETLGDRGRYRSSGRYRPCARDVGSPKIVEVGVEEGHSRTPFDAGREDNRIRTDDIHPRRPELRCIHGRAETDDAVGTLRLIDREAHRLGEQISFRAGRSDEIA